MPGRLARTVQSRYARIGAVVCIFRGMIIATRALCAQQISALIACS